MGGQTPCHIGDAPPYLQRAWVTCVLCCGATHGVRRALECCHCGPPGLRPGHWLCPPALRARGAWCAHIMHTVKSIADGSVSAKLATGLGTRQGKVWRPRPSPVVGESQFFFHKRIAQHIALISVPIVLVHLRTRSRCPPPIAAVVPPCWRPCRDMPAIQSPPQIAYQSPLVPLCCVLILLARCGAAGSLRRK